jgi:hypothetical protein
MGGINGEPRIIKGSEQSIFDIMSGYTGLLSNLKELSLIKNALDSGNIGLDGYNIK